MRMPTGKDPLPTRSDAAEYVSKTAYQHGPPAAQSNHRLELEPARDGAGRPIRRARRQRAQLEPQSAHSDIAGCFSRPITPLLTLALSQSAEIAEYGAVRPCERFARVSRARQQSAR